MAWKIISKRTDHLEQALSLGFGGVYTIFTIENDDTGEERRVTVSGSGDDAIRRLAEKIDDGDFD